MNLTFKLLAAGLVLAATSAAPARAENYNLSRHDLLDFVNTRYQAYFHYNMCTFKNANSTIHYGRCDGTEPLSMWVPTGLDCAQWAQTVIDARMAGGWLTTKHHGGFCVWDSAYTTYDVASTSVPTDVVAAFVTAFRNRGLKVGLYYSVLDYHHGIENGSVTRSEIDFIKNQLTELLTNYGPIDYLNFDGWSTWPTTPDFDDILYGEIRDHVKQLQPDCLIISHTYESNLAHADVPFADAAGQNYPYHPDYLRPTAASDYLENDWWYDADYYTVKSASYVLGKLNSYNSRNSVYILNVSPNTAGRLEATSVARLQQVAAAWSKPADIPRYGANWGFNYDVNRNLAFLKPCTQSSTEAYIRDMRAYPRAEIAVDGVTEGNLLMEQTSYTQVDPQAWWQVDLEQPEVIEQIVIWNRSDAFQERLSNYTVSVLDALGQPVWSSHQTSHPNPSATFFTGGVTGQFVRIQLDGTDHLHLAEVIVTGPAGLNTSVLVDPLVNNGSFEDTTVQATTTTAGWTVAANGTAAFLNTLASESTYGLGVDNNVTATVTSAPIVLPEGASSLTLEADLGSDGNGIVNAWAGYTARVSFDNGATFQNIASYQFVHPGPQGTAAWETHDFGAIAIPGGTSTVVLQLETDNSNPGAHNDQAYLDNIVVHVEAPLPPAFSEPPVNATRTLGDTTTPVVFSVSATTVDPPLTYQWRANGVPLGGQTGSTLSLANADLTTYDVVVTNAIGLSAPSPSATIVETVPAINEGSRNVATGASTTFSITMGTGSAYTYQWFHENAPISGATAATFVLSNPAPVTDDGSYRVEVTYNGRTVSSEPVSLTVGSVITYVDATPSNTTIDGAAIVLGTNVATTRVNVPTASGVTRPV